MKEEVFEGKKRIDWIDIAKGYGIIFVIFGHISSGPIGSIICKWIYSFHMPLFFFLSGYVFSTNRCFSDFIKRKCQTLVIPYFCLGIIMIPFQILYNFSKKGINVRESLLMFVDLLVQKRMWTIWFLACLFWMNVFFYILVKVFRTTKQLFVVSIVMLILGLMYYSLGGGALPWNIDVCFTTTIFFFAGYWLKLNSDKVYALFNVTISIVVFFTAFLINICFTIWGSKITGEGLNIHGSKYGCPPLTILAAFAGIIVIVIFSHWTTYKIVKYIGRNSLIYFAWHQTIVIPIVRMVFKKIDYIFANDLLLLIEGVIEIIIVLLICTMCHIIVSKTRLRFCLGQFSKRD